MSETEAKSATDLMKDAIAAGLTQAEALNVLHDAFNGATEDEIERAKEEHAFGSDDQIEIDDNALTSRADDGLWVMAWVWMRHLPPKVGSKLRNTKTVDAEDEDAGTPIKVEPGAEWIIDSVYEEEIVALANVDGRIIGIADDAAFFKAAFEVIPDIETAPA